MPDSVKTALHPAASAHTPKALNDAIDLAIGDLQIAADLIQKDANDLVSSAARSLNDSAMALAKQVLHQTGAVVSEAEHDLRAHPLAAAAGVAVAAAALTGLVVAALTHKAAPHAPPPAPKPR